MTGELPAGWVEATLGDVTEPRGEKADPATLGELPFVGMDHIEANTAKLLGTQPVSELKSNVAIFKEGDILYGRLRPYLNKVHMAEFDGAASAEFIIFPPSPAIEQRFLQAVLRSPSYRALADKRSTGDRPRVKFERVSDHSFPLPPLAEQRRIVRKLDRLTAHSTTARTHLTALKTLVERYKAGFLASAFRGQLFQSNPVGTPENEKAGLWGLPKEWNWVAFGDAAKICPSLTPVSEIKKLPHIAPDSLEKNTGRLISYRTIEEDGVISAKHRFLKGQIVYSKIRPYLRKVMMADFDGACSADMYPISAKENCDVKYLFYWLLSEDFSYFASKSDGRTVLPKINMKQMNATFIPLPPLEEQREIVRRIDAAFARIDLLAREAERALKLLGHLDQRILERAFCGGLVSQNPEDEPAAALLARIKTTRAATPAKKRRRRAKA